MHSRTRRASHAHPPRPAGAMHMHPGRVMRRVMHLHAMHTLAVLVLVPVLLLLQGDARAQGGYEAADARPVPSSIGAGILLSWEAGVPLDLSRRAGAVEWCACDGRGVSWSHEVALGGLLRLANLPWNGTALTARLALAAGAGRFTSHPYVTDPVLDPVSNVVVTPTVEFVAEARPVSLGADLRIELPVGDRIALEAGPWFQARLGGTFTLHERLVAPRSLQAGGFSGGERLVADGRRIASEQFTGGIAAGLVWNAPLAGDRLLRIGLGARLDLPALELRQGLRAISSMFDVALVFGGTAARIEPPLPPRLSAMWAPVVRTEAPPADVERRLGASIDLFSRDAAGERMQRAMVRTTRVRMEQTCVLHPVIPFERHAAGIPSRYVLVPQERTSSYVTDRLARPTPVELVYDILNVIGYRMRIHSGASLVVRGSSAPDEAPALALARAETVAQYLRGTWGIAASRLRIETGAPSAAVRTGALGQPDDLCAVEFSAPESSPLLAPWHSAWDVEDFTITPVFLDPAIVSDADIASWRIRIAQADREIATFTSAREAMQDHVDLSVLVRERDGALPPLSVTFEVTERTGRTITAHDTLEIVSADDRVFGASELLPPRSRTVETWVVDGSDLTLSQSGRRNRAFLRDIVAGMSTGDAVAIAPLLEGGAGAALATAQQRRERAQHVASVLLIEAGERKPTIHLTGGRYTYAAPSGDLPELGFLTSLVVVTIEREAARR